MYMIVATVTWLYLTPELARMQEFSAGWILEIFARNQVMLIALATILHVRLWTNKSQGYQYKWSPNWMSKSKKFLWERSGARQCILERRQRRHNLDRLLR